MYMGHVAVGIAAKGATPDTPIVALALAPITPDLGDIMLGIVGVRHSWHYTHTLPAAAALAIAVGMIGLVVYGRRAAAVLAALAATHVPLDYVTSRLGMLPSGPKVGLGLYAQPVVDLVVESLVIAAGWWLYRSTLPDKRRNHAAVPAIAAVMLVFQAIWAAML